MFFEVMGMQYHEHHKDLYHTVLLQDYSNHEEFGQQFKDFLDQLVEEFGLLPADEPKDGKDGKDSKDGTEKDGAGKDGGKNGADGAAEGKGRKRKITAAADSAKRPKVESNKLKTIESVGKDGALVETPLINAKIEGVVLHIKPQNKPYIFNNGSQEAGLKAGLILCGFGKGSWKLRDGTTDAGNPQKEILFNLEGPDDVVPCH